MSSYFYKFFGLFLIVNLFQCGILSPDNKKDEDPFEIQYIISGGFAGILDETTVDESGYSQLTDRSYNILCYQLPDSALDTLHDCIRNSCFFLLKNNYETDTPWADGFQYQITVTQNEKSKTVQTIDGAEIPDRLKKLLQCLQDINRIIRENGEEIILE